MEEKGIEITIKDVEFIMADDFMHFPKLEQSGFCMTCGGSLGDNVTEIVDYKIFLADSYDIILKGKCKKCGHAVNRLIETGENEESIERAQAVIERLN